MDAGEVGYTHGKGRERNEVNISEHVHNCKRNADRTDEEVNSIGCEGEYVVRCVLGLPRALPVERGVNGKYGQDIVVGGKSIEVKTITWRHGSMLFKPGDDMRGSDYAVLCWRERVGVVHVWGWCTRQTFLDCRKPTTVNNRPMVIVPRCDLTPGIESLKQLLGVQ